MAPCLLAVHIKRTLYTISEVSLRNRFYVLLIVPVVLRGLNLGKIRSIIGASILSTNVLIRLIVKQLINTISICRTSLEFMCQCINDSDIFLLLTVQVLCLKCALELGEVEVLRRLLLDTVHNRTVKRCTAGH